MRNASLRFVCRDVNLRVETQATPFTSTLAPGSVISIPVAHGDGNYYASPDTIASLEDEDRVVFRYCDQAGELTAAANPNGSTGNIAGILGAGRNVLGMMPHPERHTETLLGCDDGRHLFESAFAWLEGAHT
jgi:phosphoribosylformylglycinamidine synthase